MKTQSYPTAVAQVTDSAVSPESAKLSQWLSDLDKLDFAFQPIVHALTGITYGVEALLRGYEKLGFESPKDLFDAAFIDEALFIADIRLREKAIAKFKTIEFHEKLILFYNYDPRILDMPDYRPGVTERLMTNSDLSSDQICFEINEKYQINSHVNLSGFVKNLQERGIRIALDDFGSGYAGFELFYHSDPSLLKFDRFLISNIQSDARKRNLCSHMVNLCKTQGVTTIAEGIETAEEFRTCRLLGFDLVQGYFIEYPLLEAPALHLTYEHIRQNEGKFQRRGVDDTELITRSILRIETINITDDVRTLLDKFHDQLYYNFFPILDTNGYPLGIIHERTIKQYIYSPFGKELLANKSVTRDLRNFVTQNPTTDINTPQDKILEIFVNNPDCEGVIIVKNMKYFGFLNAKSLLGIINEKNLAAARDTNPLTGLPGNNMIHAFILDSVAEPRNHSYFVYFDFDHFKPFNDRFGFRQGDRALTLFADILRAQASAEMFIGHVGGDDFFIGIESAERRADDILARVENIQHKFKNEMKPFFSPDERTQGYYISSDRNNESRRFPMLSISAAIIELVPGHKPNTAEEISLLLAKLKKEAKGNERHVAAASYGE